MKSSFLHDIQITAIKTLAPHKGYIALTDTLRSLGIARPRESAWEKDFRIGGQKWDSEEGKKTHFTQVL